MGHPDWLKHTGCLISLCRIKTTFFFHLELWEKLSRNCCVSLFSIMDRNWRTFTTSPWTSCTRNWKFACKWQRLQKWKSIYVTILLMFLWIIRDQFKKHIMHAKIGLISFYAKWRYQYVMNIWPPANRGAYKYENLLWCNVVYFSLTDSYAWNGELGMVFEYMTITQYHIPAWPKSVT